MFICLHYIFREEGIHVALAALFLDLLLRDDAQRLIKRGAVGSPQAFKIRFSSLVGRTVIANVQLVDIFKHLPGGLFKHRAPLFLYLSLIHILLTYMTKRVTLVKTLYYVPCIITTVAIAQLFRSVYSTEPMGLLNQFLQFIGLDHMVTSWLANVGTALAAVSVPEGWRFTGMYMVIFYAALVSLDPSVYEAAKVDGASAMQILFRIQLPLIKDLILLTLTMCLTGALRAVSYPHLI